MKTSTVVTALAASVGLGSAQISFSNTTNSFVCPASGGSFCAGNSLSTNIIIRCSGTKGTPGNCNDNLAGVPPVGVKAYAPCYQSSPTTGDAACSYNGTVYPDDAYPYPVSSATLTSSATIFSDPCTDDTGCGATSTSTAAPSSTTCTTTTSTSTCTTSTSTNYLLAVIPPPSSIPSSSSAAAPTVPSLIDIAVSSVTLTSTATIFSDPCTDDTGCGAISTSTAAPSSTACTTTTSTSTCTTSTSTSYLLAVIPSPSTIPSSSSAAAAASTAPSLTGIALTPLSSTTTTSSTTTSTPSPNNSSSPSTTSLTGIALTPLSTYTSLPLNPLLILPSTYFSRPSLPSLAPVPYSNSSTLLPSTTSTSNITASITNTTILTLTTTIANTSTTLSLMTPTSNLPASFFIGTETASIIATGTTTVPSGSISTNVPKGSSGVERSRRRVEWMWVCPMGALGWMVGFML